jgi:hypothetical protein
MCIVRKTRLSSNVRTNLRGKILEIFGFFKFSNFCLPQTHIHTLTLTVTHTLTYTHSYRHTLTHIRLIRIERAIVSLRYNVCRGWIMHLELGS